MRNPIRLKNFRLRFLPYFLIGIAVVAVRRPPLEGFALGVPLVALGVVLRSWAAGHLVKNDRLTTTGPYAHLRHPLYLGTLLVSTGFALILGGYVALAVLAIVWPWFAFHYFPRKELAECARLSALHGERFARYRASVPALWPGTGSLGATPRPGEGTAPEAEAAAESEVAKASTWRLARYSDNNELGTVLAVLAALALLVLRTGWGRT